MGAAAEEHCAQSCAQPHSCTQPWCIQTSRELQDKAAKMPVATVTLEATLQHDKQRRALNCHLELSELSLPAREWTQTRQSTAQVPTQSRVPIPTHRAVHSPILQIIWKPVPVKTRQALCHTLPPLHFLKPTSHASSQHQSHNTPRRALTRRAMCNARVMSLAQANTRVTTHRGAHSPVEPYVVHE